MPELSTEFWIGTVIAVVTLLLGLGVTLAMDARTRGEFRFAVVCFLISAILAVYGIVEFQMLVKWSSRSRIVVAYLLLALVIVIAGEAIRWAKGRHEMAQVPKDVKLPPPSQIANKDNTQAKPNKSESAGKPEKPPRILPPHASSPGGANWVSALKSPPTMGDVFTNDFPNTMKLSDDAIGIEWKDNGTSIHIKRQLYLDFPANSKFVGFYVPTSNPSDLSRTTEVCLKLAQVDAVQQALDDLPKKTFIAAGLGQTTTIQDLTFSGRVVIYHDDFLSITQQSDIIRAFAAKHYAVGFFGPNDFGKVLISWHHQHDTKGTPQ
jgi:hypothetical protein